MKLYRSLCDVISSDNKDTIIVSHRGDCRQEPENSIAAIMRAIESGADMVEIDAQCTNNGTLYLMHDDTTDRTTNRYGATKTIRDEESDSIFLRRSNGGSNSEITRVTIPTLADALEAARDRVCLNIDTKHRSDLEEVGNLVFKMGMEEQVLIKMNVDPANPDPSIREESWFGRLNFMPVMLEPREGSMANDALHLVQYYDAKILEISFLSLEELRQTSDKMQKYGVRLWCNTLDAVHPINYSDSRALENPDAVWGTLIRNGIGAIQTDKTEELKNFLS